MTIHKLAAIAETLDFSIRENTEVDLNLLIFRPNLLEMIQPIKNVLLSFYLSQYFDSIVEQRNGKFEEYFK